MRAKHRNYHKNAITFTSYKIEEFWEISKSSGFTPLGIVLEPHNRYAYYYLAKG